jgi:hypothetical protein
MRGLRFLLSETGTVRKTASRLVRDVSSPEFEGD